jgi:NTP pyrophosphatase (non-canonical NTP hydrolase)
MAKQLRLDDLYKMVAYIYREQNAQRSPSATFAHFVEVCGMLTRHDRKKRREGFSVIDALCKALGWYFPLMAKFRVRSVEEIIFRKYPYSCPYCRLEPHRDERCKLVLGTEITVDKEALKESYRANALRRPVGLNDWQKMFLDIYPRSPDDRAGRSTIGLFEEIGELAEAIRVFERHPNYFAGEAADTFSYLMGIANEVAMRSRQENEQADAPLFSLQDEFLKRYPGLCPQCGSQICVCPSVPESTVGRMAKELEIGPIENLFNPEPSQFDLKGKEIAGIALEEAGGYRGLADSFPFDRGDANHALVMLCLKLGDALRDRNSELSERFHSAAIRLGSIATAPGARATPIDVTDLLASIKTAWRELDKEAKRSLETRNSELSFELVSAFGKLRVLFVSCSPSNEKRLRGDRELRAIREALRLANRENDIVVKDLIAATPDDFRRAFLRGEYDIVHFSGHSNRDVLVFEDAAGKSTEIALQSLAEFIRGNPAVRCIILNSCDSLTKLTIPIAEFTIGMDNTIDDDAAIEFAKGFYDAIAAGRDFDSAVKEGTTAAKFKGLEVPVKLIQRP